jgi:DNA-directed RNA polymerase specialized sigma24 family protein
MTSYSQEIIDKAQRLEVELRDPETYAKKSHGSNFYRTIVPDDQFERILDRLEPMQDHLGRVELDQEYDRFEHIVFREIKHRVAPGFFWNTADGSDLANALVWARSHPLDADERLTPKEMYERAAVWQSGAVGEYDRWPKRLGDEPPREVDQQEIGKLLHEIRRQRSADRNDGRQPGGGRDEDTSDTGSSTGRDRSHVDDRPIGQPYDDTAEEYRPGKFRYALDRTLAYEPSPTTEANRNVAENLRPFLDALPRQQRLAVHGRYWQGLTVREISALMGSDTSGTKSGYAQTALKLARDRLRDALVERYAPDASLEAPTRPPLHAVGDTGRRHASTFDRAESEVPEVWPDGRVCVHEPEPSPACEVRRHCPCEACQRVTARRVEPTRAHRYPLQRGRLAARDVSHERDLQLRRDAKEHLRLMEAWVRADFGPVRTAPRPKIKTDDDPGWDSRRSFGRWLRSSEVIRSPIEWENTEGEGSSVPWYAIANPPRTTDAGWRPLFVAKVGDPEPLQEPTPLEQGIDDLMRRAPHAREGQAGLSGAPPAYREVKAALERVPNVYQQPDNRAESVGLSGTR